jgi:chromatin segregation and condensation protein Rec8/ScpA/Scc1 (kleisin family)
VSPSTKEWKQHIESFVLNSLKENMNNNIINEEEKEATPSKKGRKQPTQKSPFKGGGGGGGGNVSFQSLCGDSDRRFVSRCFLELLHLKTQNKIDLYQETPYGSIVISPPADGAIAGVVMA